MKTIYLTLLLCVTSVSFAIQPPNSKAEFCSSSKEPNFYQDLILEEENRLSFLNHGGLLNSGVCWWHSRFTRNALYLGIWRPELERPSLEGRRKLVQKVKRGLNTITIPGYHNLKEFSEHNSVFIQHELEKWQKVDGVLKNKWVDGMLGVTKMPKKMLKWHMDRIYKHFKRNDDLVFLRAQIKGIAAHSFLLTKMEKQQDGYLLTVIDSNQRDPFQIKYSYGMKYFKYFNMRYIPYLQFRPELKKLRLIQKIVCSPS